MRGKKVTVVGFGSEVAIGAKGEAFSGFDQKLLPHLCDLRCSSVLMSHTMKLWERVIERRLRKETQVTENQFGFMV